MPFLFGNIFRQRWKTPEELEKVIKEYFDMCIKEERPFTVSGLAIALGTSRRTLLNYQENYGQKFHLIIKAAKTLCENYAEEKLFTKSTVAGIIFNLKNNYPSWIEEQTIKHSGLGQLLKQINEEKEQPIKETEEKADTEEGSQADMRRGNNIGSTEDLSKKPAVETEQSILD